MQNFGGWLCSSGDYHKLVVKLCGADPRLRLRDPKNQLHKIPWPPNSPRLVVLELDADASPIRHTAHDPRSLSAYLGHQCDHPASEDQRRVYILEGLHPEFVSTLGSHFKMHPSFFAEHERVAVISFTTQWEVDTAVLPAVMQSREHDTMKYFELFRLPPHLRGIFDMSCAVTGRHIGITRTNGKFSDIGTLRRKCSVWKRVRKAGPGWDCVIITDPPLRSVSVARPTILDRNARQTYSILPDLIEGGYVDFMPDTVQMKSLCGPPRTSMMDDLCFYIENHSARTNNTDPESATVFAKKIVASHYLQHQEFLRSVVQRTHLCMSRMEVGSLDSFNSELAGSLWSDCQALERRLSEYIEDLEGVMLQNPSTSKTSRLASDANWDDVTADFSFLHVRFMDVQRRAEILSSAITALVSMCGNRQALKETKSTKALTFVGLVFIPLAYTSSLFSMTDPFGPGDRLFWVYFATSVPFILLAMSLYYVLDLWFGSHPQNWQWPGPSSRSLRRFPTTLSAVGSI